LTFSVLFFLSDALYKDSIIKVKNLDGIHGISKLRLVLLLKFLHIIDQGINTVFSHGIVDRGSNTTCLYHYQLAVLAALTCTKRCLHNTYQLIYVP